MTIDTFSKGEIPYPVGTIIFWHGNSSKIPPGWEVCDGNNGTPNLLDRFIKSVPDSSTDPGTTGGENSKTLTTSQLPSHNHTASADTIDGHRHGVPRGRNSDSSNSSNMSHGPGTNRGNTTSGGAHSHTITTSSTGNDDAIDNRPAFCELIPIQKQEP